jgi:[histone H3]-trimethyl-L-lysine4 demethylase
MIECELCHEWYHGKCLKIARGKVKEDDKYTCPICDWRVKIPRDAARPKLEDLQAWYDELPNLPFQPEEEATLTSLCDAGQAFRDFLRPYINPIVTSSEEVGTLRFHLRKVEGADILLAYETNYLQQELHKWAPVAPEPPPLIEASSSTRKPRPTKQQKIMAQLGITNPEDLPQQYKIKPHIARRKASEAFGKNQLPLQPAGTGSSSPAPHPLGPQTLGTFQAAPKPGLTALAIQVLGNLASIPVAQRMLAAEPHMNREKLDKMRRLLSEDPNVPDDVEAFTARMSTLPHMPAFGYDINHKPSPVASSGRESAFREQSMFSNAGASPSAGGNGASPSLQHPRLASPANFSPAPHFAGRGSPPSPNFGTANMFDSPDAHTNGAVEFRPTVTSPEDYPSVSRMGPGMGMSMFESPRTSGANASGLASLAQASLQSPGFGGSQHSAGGLGINDVFADLVDHDAAGIDSTNDDKIADADVEAEAGVRPSTESNVNGVSSMDPQLTHDDYDKSRVGETPMLDDPFVPTTEASPGAQTGDNAQQSPASAPASAAQAESAIDPGLGEGAKDGEVQ